MKKTKIFAHRGASAYAPENTMEAFELAIAQGAEGIELDVQLTKDGVPVVIHDERIDRVTDGKGEVRGFTLEEIRGFSASNQLPGFEKAKIPTLEEVLELLAPGSCELNIELKTGIFWYPRLEEKVAELVERWGMKERVIYSSFNHYSIQRIRSLDPEAETAYLFGDILLHAERYARETGVKGLHPALYHMAMGTLAQEYTGSGLAVRVWTVNEEAHIRRMLDLGVDAIITNYPDRGARLRDEMEKR